jgi:2-keto-3-deoxy-L-rhamnonate aldolase RhmA
MKAASLKKKLKNKELTIGSWVSFGFTQTCEVMSRSGGFDWLAIDMEHTAIDFDECFKLIQLIDNTGTIPLVRIGKNDPMHIKRVMDAGAHGVIVPMVNTVEDARKAIDALYYPPIGKRGAGLGRAHNYGIGFKEYKKWADEESVLIVQIEHIEGVNNIEAILSLEHVDGFIVGPYDLSGSVGIPQEWEHPKFLESLEKVHKVLAKTNKVGGYHVVHSNRQELLNKVSQGYKFIAYGVDMVFFAEKISEEIKFMSDQNFK